MTGLLSNVFAISSKKGQIVNHEDDDEQEEKGTSVFLYFKGDWNGDLKLKDQTFTTEDLLLPISSFTGFALSLTKVVLWNKA